MEITVDGERKTYPRPLTVQEWMDLEQVRNQEVAIIHVNDRDIPPDRRKSTLLQEGDRLQLLYFLWDS